MKIIILSTFFSLLIFNNFVCGQDREFSHTEISVDVESLEIGKSLADTKSLGFDSWLNVFNNQNWSLLHSSESEYFYCAIFRHKHHVIIWFTDRKDLLKQSSFGVYSNDFKPERPDRIAKIGPSKWAVAERKIDWPTGGLTATDNATVLEIDHSLDGWLQVQVGGTDTTRQRREILKCEIPWNKDAG
ncbi:hypothetical protein [Rhodopirellula sallentina]|uniref:hypothetical protein n=1 Tax=Rhodopirellula sallentina TaxID=1263869 RepID=UPI0005C7E03E|nr:hypothetical protein [Rhodopirellula sallentina]